MTTPDIEDGRWSEKVRRGRAFNADLVILERGACPICTHPGLIVWHNGEPCPWVQP